MSNYSFNNNFCQKIIIYSLLYFTGNERPGLTLEGEEVTLWRLTSLLIGQKRSSSRLLILKSRPHILPCVIYENVDIMFIEIYSIH